jgi:C4-dicarboxylate-specific signal transduction histidine kinase
VATPTTYVLGSLETLAARLPPGSELAELVSIARDGARQLALVCRDFRALARSDDAVTDAEVSGTIQRVLRFSGALRGSHTVDVDVPTTLRAKIPESRLAQVLLNLLNGRAPVGGPSRIAIRGRRDAEHVVLSVIDEAVDTAAAVTGQAFEPFASTRPPKEGDDIGLWIVREILDAHGATISVENGPDEAVRFELRLRPAGDP